MTKLNYEQLAAVEMVCLRRACPITRLHHVRNEVIMERTNVKESINKIAEQRRLMWYGHIQRIIKER